MAFPRRARRLGAFWRTEKRTLRQGFVALLVSTAAAFVAGLTLGSITHTLEALPGLLILIPASVGMRGTIFGAIGARLGTATHAGLFEVTRAKSGVLYQNTHIGVIMTFATSMYLAVLAKLVASAFGLPTISVWDLVIISVVGGALASVFILMITIAIAVLSYRRGWDLDSVATPVITAVGDMITLPALFLATFLIRAEGMDIVLGLLCAAAGIAAIVRGATTRAPGIRRVLFELVGVALLAPILDVLAGIVADARLDEFVALPAILLLVPPFVSQAGALGGILSSRLSSKLQLGVITPRGLPEPPAAVDAGVVFGFGVVVFLLIGVVGLVVSAAAGLAGPGAGVMMAGTLVGGLMATVVAIVLGYYLAVLTSRFGLDPDNHGVPLITSTMDLAGIVCLLFAMGLFGVGHG
ncbi:MAG: magnesium transporter [Actinomycetota bacterium]